jgi:hypothetical protein
MSIMKRVSSMLNDEVMLTEKEERSIQETLLVQGCEGMSGSKLVKHLRVGLHQSHELLGFDHSK